MSSPLPVRDLPSERCRALATLFTDVDDTITRDGLLPVSTFQRLWDLQAAGIRTVVVTGRPAGWVLPVQEILAFCGAGLVVQK